VLIECNPRPTSGVSLMPDEMFIDALNDRYPDRILIGPAGVRRKMGVVIVRNMFIHPTGALRDMRGLVTGGRDLYLDGGDFAPLVYQFIAYGRVLAFQWTHRNSKHKDLVHAYLHDILWDGETLG